MTEYIVLKSQHGRIEIRITTGDDWIRIQGSLRSDDPNVDNQTIDRAWNFDDPDMNTEIGNIWSAFKSEFSALATFTAAEMEAAYTDFVNEL